eukprot:c20266_g1_i1.p2 GENE.c20266_g1_i1~~c20266_g1_i1.p2  ORF type:complete len:147 (-),score=0.72 c20266_g1_i1:232-672(-)
MVIHHKMVNQLKYMINVVFAEVIMLAQVALELTMGPLSIFVVYAVNQATLIVTPPVVAVQEQTHITHLPLVFTTLILPNMIFVVFVVVIILPAQAVMANTALDSSSTFAMFVLFPMLLSYVWIVQETLLVLLHWTPAALVEDLLLM